MKEVIPSKITQKALEEAESHSDFLQSYASVKDFFDDLKQEDKENE